MKILLAEDDRGIAMAIAYRLRKERHELTVCHEGLEAYAAIREEPFDAILLDRMLPGMHGDAILRAIRADGIRAPVMMITAMDAVTDRVDGLDLGADDYLVKPFAMEELCARVRALSRRAPDWSPADALSAGDVALNAETCELTCRGGVRSLSRREADLCAFFLRNPNKPLPRAVLIGRVWGGEPVEDGSLDIYVHFLRKHLSALNSRARIETIRGVGYRLSAPSEPNEGNHA